MKTTRQAPWRPPQVPRPSVSTIFLRANRFGKVRRSTSHVRRKVVLRMPDQRMYGPGYIVPMQFERSVEPGRCAWRGILCRYGKRR